MSPVVPPRRPIVLKTSRDTLVLLAAASAMALAIGYSVHNHTVSDDPQPIEQTVAGEWAGQLAALAPTETAAPAPAPLSSDALTLPKAAMALPVSPRPTANAVKPRLCDGVPCPPAAKASTTAAAVPGGLPTAAAPGQTHRPAVATRPHSVREAGLMERLNPLNHLPDVRLPDVVRRPFASAGETIVGWVKRF